MRARVEVKFKIYAEMESPNEGACLRYMMNPESPNEGACLKYIVKRNRQMMGRESPNEGPCLRYMMNLESPNEGAFKIYDEPESPDEIAVVKIVAMLPDRFLLSDVFCSSEQSCVPTC